jgi:thioredoxin reductase (NADPH)
MIFFSTSKNLEISDIPFISHSDKPSRKEALEYYRRIVESYDLCIHFYEEVQKVENNLEEFQVFTSKGTYSAHNVVVATGFYDKPRMLGVPGEDLPMVKHYYDEAHPYVGQKVLVVGAANSACDVALETWQKGAEVTMAIRESELYEKVKYWILPNIKNRIEEGSIKAYFNTLVHEIRSGEVILKNEDGQFSIENDFVLAMTGYMPDYHLFERIGVPIGKDEYQTPQYNEETLESTVPGLYVAGVINSGLQTSKLFIENTRDHGEKIITHILAGKRRKEGS